jgi:hypothetical protein
LRDEVTRTRARTHQAACFQQVIGLEDGGWADVSAGDELAHGGQAVAGAQGAVGDGGGEVGGQRRVQGAAV